MLSATSPGRRAPYRSVGRALVKPDTRFLGRAMQGSHVPAFAAIVPHAVQRPQWKQMVVVNPRAAQALDVEVWRPVTVLGLFGARVSSSGGRKATARATSLGSRSTMFVDEPAQREASLPPCRLTALAGAKALVEATFEETV